MSVIKRLTNLNEFTAIPNNNFFIYKFPYYCRSIVAGTYRRTHSWGSSRTGREAYHAADSKPSPESVRETLLKTYKFNNHNEDYTISRTGN